MAFTLISAIEEKITDSKGRSFFVTVNIAYDDEKDLTEIEAKIKHEDGKRYLGQVKYDWKTAATMRWDPSIDEGGRFALCVLSKILPTMAPQVEQCRKHAFSTDPSKPLREKIKLFSQCLNGSKVRMLFNFAQAVAECTDP